MEELALSLHTLKLDLIIVANLVPHRADLVSREDLEYAPKGIVGCQLNLSVCTSVYTCVRGKSERHIYLYTFSSAFSLPVLRYISSAVNGGRNNIAIQGCPVE